MGMGWSAIKFCHVVVSVGAGLMYILERHSQPTAVTILFPQEIKKKGSKLQFGNVLYFQVMTYHGSNGWKQFLDIFVTTQKEFYGWTMISFDVT